MSELNSLIEWAEKASDVCLLLFVFLSMIAFIDLVINHCFEKLSKTKIYRNMKYSVGILMLLSMFITIIYSFVMI